MPLQPRHIAVLFRRFVSFGDDVTRPYIDAIEARGIPHLLVGGKAFHGREEVETIRAALAAIEWPDDELSVFATLKGSLFAIDDEHLLEFRHRFGTFHPFRVPKELGGNGGQDLALTARADRAPDADRRRAPSAAAAAPRPQLPAGRRHHRPAARRDARARRLHSASGWRAGAGQRAARRRTGAAVRGDRRDLVPRLHRRAAYRRGERGRGSADPRRGQRRRAADDRAQGEGARVSGRDPRRPDVRDEPQGSEPLSRCVAWTVRDEDRRLGAARAPSARSRRGRARPGRRRQARLRRRHARPRSPCRPGRSATTRGTAGGSRR